MRLILVALLASTLAYSEPISNGGCDRALGLCQGVIKAQDASIAQLKGQVGKLENALAEQTSPSIPKWMYVVGGAIIGAITVGIVKK